jgi:hypothetical protein
MKTISLLVIVTLCLGSTQAPETSSTSLVAGDVIFCINVVSGHLNGNPGGPETYDFLYDPSGTAKCGCVSGQVLKSEYTLTSDTGQTCSVGQPGTCAGTYKQSRLEKK